MRRFLFSAAIVLAVPVAIVGFSALVLMLFAGCRVEPAALSQHRVQHRPVVAVYDPHQPEMTKTAIDLWNGQVGCTVFAVADDPWSADVVFTDKARDGYAGMYGYCDCKDGGCEIWINPNRIDHMDKVDTIVHELGHALGLGHAKNGTVMDPDRARRETALGPFVPILIGDKEIAAARYTRCGR